VPGLLALGAVAQLAIVSHATLDTAAAVNFHAMVLPDTVFVGQQVTYQVGVFLDDELRLRLRRNPEFVPPEPQAMLTYDLPTVSGAPPTRRVGSHEYEVHVFERAMFPLEAGHYTIPAAELSYSLPLSLSFFSREESHTLAAESLSVVALPPPVAGRPPDYSGAVGDLRVGTRLDMHRVRVGDPVLVTVEVAGRANIKLLPRPALVVPWGSAVVAQERVQIDTSSAEVRGTKEFDWVVTPRDTGALVLPPVRYPYFNPYTEKYEVALTDPATLVVGEGTLAPADSVRADAAPPLPLRTVYHGEVPRPPYTTPGFALLAAVAPLPALVITAGRRRRRRRVAPSAAVLLRAIARSSGPCDAPSLRRAFVAALAERFALSAQTLAAPGGLAKVLRREGVTAPTGQRADRLLAELDEAAYGRGETSGEPVSSELRQSAYAVYRAVAQEARAPLGTPLGASKHVIVVLAAMLVVGGSAALAAASNDALAAQEFQEGLVSYSDHHYRDAAARFAAAARLAPRATDAWANAGTAAWEVSDTADAVVGWQRAARLDAFATDMRDRLALVRAAQDGWLAAPPRVGAALVANVALACWLLACLVWAVAAARRARARSAVMLAFVAAGGAVAAAWLDEAAAAKRLAVAGPDVVLYASPALGAERLSTLDAGDVARIEGRDGAWTRVRLDGDREGWVEVERLTPLAQ
jgi:Bacterial SH3 domain/BatD DUF11 like domain